MPYVEGNYIYLVHFEKTLIKPKKKNVYMFVFEAMLLRCSCSI